MDVHVPQAITEQLRNREVDVLTANEDGTNTLPDDELLEHASELGRVFSDTSARSHSTPRRQPEDAPVRHRAVATPKHRGLPEDRCNRG